MEILFNCFRYLWVVFLVLLVLFDLLWFLCWFTEWIYMIRHPEKGITKERVFGKGSIENGFGLYGGTWLIIHITLLIISSFFLWAWFL